MLLRNVPFDLQSGPPTELVIAKPVRHGGYDPEILAEYEKNFPLMITRKWTGRRVIVTTVPAHDPHFGAQIRVCADKLCLDGNRIRLERELPHIIRDLQRLNLPPDTVLIGEEVFEEPRLSQLVLHGALCWHGEWLGQTAYDEVRALLAGLDFRKLPYVRTLRLEMGPLAKAQELAIQQKWDGLVIYRHDYTPTWFLGRGQTPRPDGAYLWKPPQSR
jgi:hypothetical protein